VNDCEAFDDEIVDVAFGVAPSHALTRHLESCSACSGNLENRRAVAQRIDRAVRALVHVEPPQSMTERIAARRRSVRLRRWSGSWVGVPIAAALAVVALIVAFGVRHPGVIHREPSTAVLTAWRSPTAALLTPHSSIIRAPLDVHLEHLL
jgi:anti-sigma factor RsiW